MRVCRLQDKKKLICQAAYRMRIFSLIFLLFASKFSTLLQNNTVICTPRGGTPLLGLNGDVRPDRVWF